MTNSLKSTPRVKMNRIFSQGHSAKRFDEDSKNSKAKEKQLFCSKTVFPEIYCFFPEKIIEKKCALECNLCA